MNYRELTTQLRTLYAPHEAEAIARLVMEERFRLSLTDLALGKDRDFSMKERAELEFIAKKLLSGMPVQQVLGYATFMGHRFEVTPDVLIPRPETAELVQWLLNDWQPAHACTDTAAATTGAPTPECTIADLCTGSGCIAVSIGLALGPSAHIHAVDVSEPALQVARRNAQAAGVNAEFSRLDILDTDTTMRALPPLDCIISNPPYIRQSEAAQMEANVLEHEPHLALFVPDEDPLRFYRHIALLGQHLLKPGGRIYMELNRALAQATADLFTRLNYSDISIRRDQFGNERMLRATMPPRAGISVNNH